MSLLQQLYYNRSRTINNSKKWTQTSEGTTKLILPVKSFLKFGRFHLIFLSLDGCHRLFQRAQYHRWLKGHFFQLEIHVYLASQQQPPEIRRNRVLVVHQSKSVTLERADLRVTHPDVRPRDITFSIREVPSHAYFLLNQTILVDGTSVAPRLVKNVTSKLLSLRRMIVACSTANRLVGRVGGLGFNDGTTFIFGTGGLWFKSRAGPILPPIQNFFQTSCIARVLRRRDGSLQTRYALWRNTASIMKDLICSTVGIFN